MTSLKKFATYSIVNGVNMVITLVATSFILSYHDITEFSGYSKVLLYLSYVVPILTFSLPSWLNNNFKRYGAKLPGSLILAILAANVLVLIPAVYFLFFPNDNYETFAMLCMITFSTSFFNIAVSYMQFANLLRLYVIGQCIYMTANIASLIIIISFQELPIETRFLVLSAGHVGVFLVLTLSSKIDFKRKWIGDLKDVFNWGRALLLHVVLGAFVISGDKLIIENNYSEVIFGQYMILGALLTPFLVLVTLLNQSLKPEIYKALLNRDQRSYEKVIRKQIAATLFFGVLFGLSSYFLIEFVNFDNGNYGLGWDVLFSAVLIITFLSLYYPFSNILLFFKRTSAISLGTYLMGGLLAIIFMVSAKASLELNDVLHLIFLASLCYAFYYQIAARRVVVDFK